MLAEGETLNPQFIASLRERKRTAHDIMSAPVVTVTGHTDVSEIGKLLTTHKIKRVPVLRDGHIVGIVSRADLIRALAAQSRAPSAHHGGLFDWANHRSHGDEQRGAESPARRIRAFRQGESDHGIGLPFARRSRRNRKEPRSWKPPEGRLEAAKITGFRKPSITTSRTSIGGAF